MTGKYSDFRPYLSLLAALIIALQFAPSALHAADKQALALDHAALIGNGEALFISLGYDPTKTPSLAFATPPRESGKLPNEWKLTPEFFTESGNAGATLAVPADASLYGEGEVTGPLLRNGTTIELWNTDNFNYNRDGGRRLYQSHPWVMGVRTDGTAFGVLFDTTWKAQLETAPDHIIIRTQGAPFRVAVVDRESPLAVLQGLAELTGKMPMPPRWALGFQQCRYSYFPDAKVRQIADEFRARKLPCDVIWLDIHYMNGYRTFTFDPTRFPNPKGTNDYLHQHGFHSVCIIDPGVKVDSNYAVYQSGSRQNVWIETNEKRTYEGKVWPGVCVFPDFTMPVTRQWWANLYRDFLATGMDGIWNDMNEPSVFDTPDWTMPEDNWHRGGGDLPAGPHLLYHNTYGMLMTRATREGVLAARPERRPFVLTRSTYLGGQRYAATWTGDNNAALSYLQQAVPMSLSLSLSGQPVSGPDIGGYAGAVTPELFGKWFAMGPFFPFFRAHTAVDNPPREPWVFGPTIEKVARVALERRYRLMPYLYTLTYESATYGNPIMEPAFFADRTDLSLRAEQQAFLFGPDLLVVPRWANSPHLPRGIWRDVSLLEAKREDDGYQPTLKIRGGAIIPLGKAVQNTNEESYDPLTLLVCLDQKGEAEGHLYEDAGDGYGYNKGEFRLTHFLASRRGQQIVVQIHDRRGNLATPNRPLRVEVVTGNGLLEANGNEKDGVTLSQSAPAPSP